MEMSKTYQYRKVMKPLLERKRRARINKCLDDLRDLMVDCMSQQGENIARLEKADVLELTVEHLKKLKNSRIRRQAGEGVESFRSGFVHAANEVSRSLASLPQVDIRLGTKLMTHLGHRLNEIESSLKKQCSGSPESSPISVYCGESNYQSQLSPVSSGYESDPEYLQSTKGLLQVAELPKISVWRPW